MNSACSGHAEEARGKTGRRKLSGVGVSDVMRWLSRWLRRHQLRWWWPELAVGGKGKKLQMREKGWKEKREKVTVAALPLVRSWVDGNNGGKAGCGGVGRWQRKQMKKKTGGAAEMREKPAVALGGQLVVVSCGGVDGGKTGDESGGGWRPRWRGKREKLQKQGKWLLFWLILDPIFSSLKPSNPPLFIGGGRGKSFLQWRKISALDSDGKDPNRWLKVGMVYCQIVKSAAAGCLSWPLWGGATSVYLLVSQWRPYPDIEGYLMISAVHVLANLVDVRCIKCTYKGGDWTSFSEKEEEDNE